MSNTANRWKSLQNCSLLATLPRCLSVPPGRCRCLPLAHHRPSHQRRSRGGWLSPAKPGERYPGAARRAPDGLSARLSTRRREHPPSSQPCTQQPYKESAVTSQSGMFLMQSDSADRREQCFPLLRRLYSSLRGRGAEGSRGQPASVFAHSQTPKPPLPHASHSDCSDHMPRAVQPGVGSRQPEDSDGRRMGGMLRA